MTVVQHEFGEAACRSSVTPSSRATLSRCLRSVGVVAPGGRCRPPPGWPAPCAAQQRPPARVGAASGECTHGACVRMTPQLGHTERAPPAACKAHLQALHQVVDKEPERAHFHGLPERLALPVDERGACGGMWTVARRHGAHGQQATLADSRLGLSRHAPKSHSVACQLEGSTRMLCAYTSPARTCSVAWRARALT